MKRAKKLLVTLLVLTFVLSAMSVGLAAPKFSDIEDADVADSVVRLVALNIINGYPDGTFKPGQQITRAEFAKVIVNAVGVGKAAEYAAGVTQFKDVPADFWAAGYIKVASDMGIVNGRGNGIFDPQANVTYAESITMIVRALGYEPKAKALGGYPGGYIAIAAEKEITDGVNVVNTLAATRGDVALMLDNSLEVALMEQVSWGQYPEYKENEDKSLLVSKLGVNVIEGTVTDFDAGNKLVTIGGKEYDVANDVSFIGLLDAEVTAWKLDKKIVYFFEDSDVLYDSIVAFSDSKKTVELAYADKKYKVVKTDDFDYDDVKALGNIYGKFVLNNGKISSAEELLSTERAAILTSKNDKEGKEYIKYQIGDLAERTFKFDFEDEDYTFVKNNKVAAFKDLKEGDVVYVNTTDKVVVAFDLAVEGKLTRLGSDYVNIDGKKYEFISPVYSSIDDGEEYEAGVNEDLLAEEVVAYKGANGKIVYIKSEVEESTSKLYGFVLSTTESLDTYKARVLLADGTTATYELKNVDVYDDIVAKVADNSKDLAAYFKFSVNKDGQISKAEAYESEAAVTGSLDDAGKSFLKIGGQIFYVADDIKVFNIEDAFSTLNITKSGDVKMVDWAKIADAKSVTDIEIIGYPEMDGAEIVELKAIAIKAGYGTAAGDPELAYVKDAYKISKDEWEVVLVNASEEITLVFDEDMTEYVDMVIEYRVNSDGDGVWKSTVAEYKPANFKEITDVDTTKSMVTVDGTVYKVSKDAIIFNLNGDTPEQIVLSDIKAELETKAAPAKINAVVYNDPETTIVKAILVEF
jgi:hypothetical protein